LKLNREKVAAGLSLLLLVFGVYGVVGRRLAEEAPEISTAVPPYTQEVQRLEPRLFFEEAGAARNPFQVASDWVAITPEPLPAPPMRPAGWVLLPLGTSADPAESGLVFLRDSPMEQKADDEADRTENEKDSAGAEKTSADGEAPGKKEADGAGRKPGEGEAHAPEAGGKAAPGAAPLRGGTRPFRGPEPAGRPGGGGRP